MKPNRKIVTETLNFVDTLFLQLMYYQGHLWIDPIGRYHSVDYVLKNSCILKELSKRGVLTIQGDKSCYEFVVVIHDDNVVDFIETLFALSSFDIYVEGRQKKYTNVISEFRFGDFVNNKSDKKNSISFEVGSTTTAQYLCFEHSTLHVKLQSGTQDVEEILLYYWIGFNDKHGAKNKSIF